MFEFGYIEFLLLFGKKFKSQKFELQNFILVQAKHEYQTNIIQFKTCDLPWKVKKHYGQRR